MMTLIGTRRVTILVLVALCAASLRGQSVKPVAPAKSLCVAPIAPIHVSITKRAQGADDVLLIDVAPTVQRVEGMSWEVVAHGPAVVHGIARGDISSRGGRRRAHVSVPHGAFASVDVIVSGELVGGDAGERVTFLETVAWGTPPAPGEVTETVRGSTGEAMFVRAVPTLVTGGPTTSVASEATSFTVSGRFMFEDKAWGFSGWTGEDPLVPVRRADVTVIDAGAAEILATGQTASDGSFAFACSSSSEELDIVVRCDAGAVYDPAYQATRVMAQEGYLYAMFAPPVLDHVTSRDVDVGTTVASKVVLQGGKEGNAFNVHDAVVIVLEALHGAMIGAPPADDVIDHIWPATTTFALVGSTSIGVNDGYDDAVIGHELGHVIDSQYTTFLGGGGAHSFGDSNQNPELSFSEGFATFMAGLGQVGDGQPGMYVDSSPAGQVGGVLLRARLETAAPYANTAEGIADEVAVACALFDIADTSAFPDATPGLDDDAFDELVDVAGASGLEALWQVLTTQPQVLTDHTLNDVWDGWHEVFGDDVSAPLVAVFAGFEQRFFEDVLEPNDTSEEAALLEPVENSGWTPDMTLYRDDGRGLGPGEPDVDWYSHDLVIGSELKFVTRYPSGAFDANSQVDTQLEVYAPSGGLVASDLDSGNGRNARVDDFVITETGRWNIAVSAQTVPLRRYGRYEYRAQMLFENHVPVIGEPQAFPSALFGGGTSQLSADVTDANAGQSVDVVWAVLDGGTVSTEGVFTAPIVVAPTTLRIEARAVDELGAVSEAAIIDVLVVPDPGCTTVASVTSVGTGKVGSAGVPLLALDGLPVAGASDVTLRASQLLPDADATLIFGFGLLSVPFDGGVLHPRPDVVITAPVDASGELAFPLPIPSGPGVCGQLVVAQVFIVGDPGATGGLATAQSNGLTLVLGN